MDGKLPPRGRIWIIKFNRFLHWNIDGVISNLEDLKLLLNLHCPKVFALQETLLAEDKNISFAGYHLYRRKLDKACSDRGVAL